MPINVTVLIMSEAKEHSAAHAQMRHNKYGLVDIFPIGQLQKQTTTFYTIDVDGVPVNTLDEAKDLILPPVYAEPLLVLADVDTPEIIHRRRFILDMSMVSDDELNELDSERCLKLPWARVFDLFKDVTSG